MVNLCSSQDSFEPGALGTHFLHPTLGQHVEGSWMVMLRFGKPSPAYMNSVVSKIGIVT